ncbi:MAG: cation:proton antiporter [Calditrichia bacterium]
MSAVSTELFVYLGAIYILYPLLTTLLRKIYLQDFLAYILTGLILGFLFGGWKGTGLAATETGNIQNPVLYFLVYAGMIFFFLNLGFNLNFTIFKSIDAKSLQRTITYFLLIFLLMGVATFFLVFRRDFILTNLFISAFISINIGPVILSFFNKHKEMKKYLTSQLQIAVILDIIAICIFAVFHTISQNPGQNPLWTNMLFVFAFAFATFVLVYPPSAGRITSGLYNLSRESSLALQLGIIILLFYVGAQSGISILFLAIWLGILFKLFAVRGEAEIKKRFFSGVALLYPLPFADVGRIVYQQWNYSLWFWLYLNLIFVILLLGYFIFSIYLKKSDPESRLNSMVLFSRGELTVLILWLVYQTNLLSTQVFTAAIAAVFLTCIVARFFSARWVKGLLAGEDEKLSELRDSIRPGAG